MENTIKAFEEQMKETKAELMKMIPVDELINMDSDAFIAIQKMLKLADTSMKLVVEQAQTIDEINTKLDRLIELMRREA